MCIMMFESKFHNHFVTDKRQSIKEKGEGRTEASGKEDRHVVSSTWWHRLLLILLKLFSFTVLKLVKYSEVKLLISMENGEFLWTMDPAPYVVFKTTYFLLASLSLLLPFLFSDFKLSISCIVCPWK